MTQDEHRFAEEIDRILAATQERTDTALAELHRAEEGFREVAAAENAQFEAEADAAVRAVREAEARPTPGGAPDLKLYDDSWEERPAQPRPPARKPIQHPADEDEDFSERKWTS
ncbi:hypothetical protein [Crossiella sp. CA198]|uniref:hypothetical protein n=1 Tax=Crossiella sp. CA198 TaxID=3455607 RepID=UPI003F8D3ED8